MNCVVTAGPTHEPLDEVRRLTNFSTGRLGSQLAEYLTDQGHHVVLFQSSNAIYRSSTKAGQVIQFTTTADLAERLRMLGNSPVDAVFHAAAVSDFCFGKVWSRRPTGELSEVQERKISSRRDGLLVELVPTPKIIGQLRRWFPQAWLVGWKYENDGGREGVVAKAQLQICENQTDACVANGPAYGEGFGFVTADGVSMHLPSAAALFDRLAKCVLERARAI